MKVMGLGVAHESAHAHVTGRAPYVDDIPEWLGSLHAAPILSDHAHAELLGIDAQKALAMPGVVTVLTAQNLKALACTNAFPTQSHDEPIFAEGKLLHRGQVVGLVIATSHWIARAAARQVIIEAKDLPAILSIEEALKEESFVLPPVFLTRGNPEQTISQAAHQLSKRFHLGGQEHFYLESQAAYALPQEQGQMLVHSSSQHPGEVQHWVAHALGLSNHQVRVECRRMGGGFGGKETQAGQVAVWAALAAKVCGKAVKMRLDRDDDFLITGKRHPFFYDYTVGFDKTGRLEGLSVLIASNCGFSVDLSGPVADRAVFHLDNAYCLEHLSVRSYRCRTNLQSMTAFRGFGGPQGMVLIETIMGDVARALQKDPIDIRLQNTYDPLEASSSASVRSYTHYGMQVEDNIAPAMMQALVDQADYRKRREQLKAFNNASAVVKKGMALT
ncbi:MAG: molybdopterin cofactor-binding domain-containing protein, partial [Burkholderiaceae bacterium]